MGPAGGRASASLWQSLADDSVEAVFSGRLEVDVGGLHLLGLRVPHIFESLPLGAHHLVVDVSDQLFGGLSGNQLVSGRSQEEVSPAPHPPQPSLSPPWEPWAGESSDPLHCPPSCTCQKRAG